MTTLSRKLLITGTTAVAAFAMVACTPPNENDSDLKVDTATSVAAPTQSATTSAAATEDAAATTTAIAAAELPGYIDCVATPAQEPVTISLNCADNSDQITEIEWDSWEEDSATGTGSRIVFTPAGEQEVTEDVEVELTFPTETSQGLAFSQVTVDGEAVFL